MDFKNILVLVAISLLLFGAVSAQKTVNDFKVDESYGHVYNGTNLAVYLNEKQDAGITLYKQFGDDDADDVYDELIHDDGMEYLTPDDDMGITKNSDNTVNFTDHDHAQHGAAELINSDGENFIVVVWAKDSSDVSGSDLISKLNDFNKDNNVNAISF